MKESFKTSLTVITVGVGVLFMLTLPTMWLWNYIIPTIFNLPEITVWQTLALLILSQILIKNNNSISK